MEANNLVLDRHVLLVGRMVLFTMLSGLADAKGFVYSARAWDGGDIHWLSLCVAAGYFLAGLGTYWMASHDLALLGVGAPEAQTLFWFMMLVIGLAVFSGQFFKWPAMDQGIAAAVVAGLCLLIVRLGSH